MRRVRLRSDNDEVVVHEVKALHALSFGHELVLGRPVMHEHDIRIAASPDIERLSRADGDDFHLDSARLGEAGQKIAEQAGLLSRGGRGDRDGAILGRCRVSEQSKAQKQLADGFVRAHFLFPGANDDSC